MVGVIPLSTVDPDNIYDIGLCLSLHLILFYTGGFLHLGTVPVPYNLAYEFIA